METNLIQSETAKDRLGALLEAVLQKSKLNRAFLPTIRTLAKNFLNDIPEDDLRAGIMALRDDYIPWLLNEARHENTPPE